MYEIPSIEEVKENPLGNSIWGGLLETPAKLTLRFTTALDVVGDLTSYPKVSA